VYVRMFRCGNMISKQIFVRSSVPTARKCRYRECGLDVWDLFMDAKFLRCDTVKFMENVVRVPSMPSSLYELKEGDTEAADTVGRIRCSE